jgi:hypothetical protein
MRNEHQLHSGVRFSWITNLLIVPKNLIHKFLKNSGLLQRINGMKAKTVAPLANVVVPIVRLLHDLSEHGT